MAKKPLRTRAPYLDPSLPVDDRVADLLSRMTLEEKWRQMGCHEIGHMVHRGKFSRAKAAKVLKGQPVYGALLFPAALPIKQGVEAVSQAKAYLKKRSRLYVPPMIFHETLHGLHLRNTTIFPMIIGMASTWNPSLVHTMATIAAREARAAGIAQGLAPNLDLAREPRFGRVEEMYGEDPYLVSRMGEAYVRGLQGHGPMVDDQHIVATIKHFVPHGSPEAGMNISPIAGGPRQLRELFLPPFHAAVKAGALSVMPAYGEYDGIPAHANAELLTKILRQEWGFNGYVFSDFAGIYMIHRTHFAADSFTEAGRQALQAGVDLEANYMEGFTDELREKVRAGRGGYPPGGPGGVAHPAGQIPGRTF